jgi:hypothetical protein
LLNSLGAKTGEKKQGEPLRVAERRLNARDQFVPGVLRPARGRLWEKLVEAYFTQAAG